MVTTASIAYDNVVRAFALGEVAAVTVMMVAAFFFGLRRWHKADVREQTLVKRLALGRIYTTFAIALWSAALFAGILDRWGEPLTWRYALYIAACPPFFASFLLVDRQRWMSS